MGDNLGRHPASSTCRTRTFRVGYFPISISNAYERRVSAAVGYLDPATRARENQTLLAGTRMDSLLFEGTRCVGIKARVQGRETEFRATR